MVEKWSKDIEALAEIAATEPQLPYVVLPTLLELLTDGNRFAEPHLISLVH